MSVQVFEPGQVVYLKSGSPPLTVYSVRGDGHVNVEWFHDGKPHRDAFPAECLTTTEPTHGA